MIAGHSGRSLSAIIATLRRSQSGAAAIEFALLGPLFFIMLFGVLQMGVYLQNYNAVQSVAYDGARSVMIEFQKDNPLSDDQIRSVIIGMATNDPYLLESDNLDVTVDRSGESRVTGAIEIDVRVRYTLTEFIPGLDLPLSEIDYSRSVWVVEE